MINPGIAGIGTGGTTGATILESAESGTSSWSFQVLEIPISHLVSPTTRPGSEGHAL
jgi:hypothetical protein